LEGQPLVIVDTFFNLPALTTYDLLVEDAAGCTYSLSNIIVGDSEGINAADIGVVNANCGATDGAIAVNNVQGGLAPYVYELNAVTSINGEYQNLGAGNYNLVITDDNSCTYGQLIVIPTNPSPEDIFVPNVITMNGDNTNDLWFVKADCVEKFECSIINRWGNLIYEYQDISGSWNGKDLSGTNVNEGVYFYKINITFFGGNKHELQGFITVTE
jgi:gliding motility-associated-like protein